MKTIYRAFGFGVLAIALTVTANTSLFAQEPCADIEAQQAVYKKFTDNYAGKIAQREVAVAAGKEYVEKYGNCPESKDIVAYLNSTVPPMEKKIEAERKAVTEKDRYDRFDTALKAKNTGSIFSVGKEILAVDPDLVDVMLVLATAGYDQASAKPPVDSYNNEAINYARSAIQALESGTKSKTGDYGVLSYSYSNKDNALGWMNYIVGYVDYYRLGKKDEGLSYIYKASKANSTTKTNPFLYQTLGEYYRDEVVVLGNKIVEGIKATGKETDETKALFAMQKGYADRAIDAYARAYKATDAKDKAYKDGLYERIKEIYKLRFEGKEEGIDAYVAAVANKPMPDPTTKVTPVIEGEAATATTSGTTSPTAAKPPATKPAASTDNKKPPTTPMSSTTTESTTKVTVTKNADKTSANGTAKTKTPAKKPAPKKKGTR